MTNCSHVSILYLSIGSGHQVAAESVAAALQRRAPEVTTRVIDPFGSTIDILPSILERLQAASVMLTPGIYDSIWRQGTGGSIFEWVTDLEILRDLMMETLCEDGSSDIVVATHVLPCAIAAALRKSGLARKVFGIVTDFGLHTLWPVTGIDSYFVGHQDVGNTMIYRGVKPQNVYATGIPIRLGFEQATHNEPNRIVDPLRVLLIAGGIRGGSYTEVKQYLYDLMDGLAAIKNQDLIVTIVTGKDRRLRERLEERAESNPVKIQVRSFVDDMYALMREQDVLIGKPGGLIVSEALASGICMILFKPGPGQEAANVDFLARHGVAFRGESVSEVIRVLEYCVANPDTVYEIKHRAWSLGRPNAASEIANRILEGE